MELVISNWVQLLLCLIFPAAVDQSQPGRKADAFVHFRPRHEISGEAFVGNAVCASCHAQKNRTQSETSMAHAMTNPRASSILKSQHKMTLHTGAYTFEIFTEGRESVYRVSDGKETVSEPIAYVFGDGRQAQTFILRHKNKLYEGRVSYYRAINGLDWTIGDELSPAPNVEEAFGRDISGDEATNCFGCHGTGAIAGGKLDLDQLAAGVTCEGCHGPGKSHAAAMLSGTGENLFIFDPRKLSADTLSQEFCGGCHRSADTVGMMPDLGGVRNVRFQPYRLATGKHDANDPHFACTACHDPHIDLPLQASADDSKCTVCHSSTSSRRKSLGGATAKPCPLQNNNCVSCHMPKVEIPGTHLKFTDHRIRIVRSGHPFPL